MEARGDRHAAGAFYVAAECKEDARRCLADMELTEHNWRCLSRAGFARQVADHFLGKGDYKSAALAMFDGDDALAGAQILERAGDIREAACELRNVGLFGEAARMFRKSGDRAQAARMWEYAKQWAEAAALWNELGDIKRRDACVKKALRAGQKWLFR